MTDVPPGGFCNAGSNGLCGSASGGSPGLPSGMIFASRVGAEPSGSGSAGLAAMAASSGPGPAKEASGPIGSSPMGAVEPPTPPTLMPPMFQTRAPVAAGFGASAVSPSFGVPQDASRAALAAVSRV